MRSLQLQSALSAYVDAAAAILQADVAAGAEVQLEVGAECRGSRGTPLYSYRALTGAFIDEREDALQRLPEHVEAARLLEGFDGLERYATASGGPAAHAKGRARVCASMKALLEDVFEGQTEFHLHPDRVQAALGRLESAAVAGPNQVTLVATLHGIQISSPEVQLAKGLRISQPSAVDGVPDAVCPPQDDARVATHLLVMYTAESQDAPAGVEHGRELLGELQRALRLFGDGRVRLGPLAWARIETGARAPVVLGGASAQARGILVVSVEQEDELRAFCNLVSRRAPRRDEVAWALRRFELGCDRPSAHEAITDHLLALRALLEPEGPASALLAGRLAALCATPDERSTLTERVGELIALERAVCAGESVKPAAVRSATEELSGHLRALLSDVICGHLDRDLTSLADELLLDDALSGSNDAEEVADELEEPDSLDELDACEPPEELAASEAPEDLTGDTDELEASKPRRRRAVAAAR
jgi:hypothetical protein